MRLRGAGCHGWPCSVSPPVATSSPTHRWAISSQWTMPARGLPRLLAWRSPCPSPSLVSGAIGPTVPAASDPRATADGTAPTAITLHDEPGQPTVDGDGSRFRDRRASSPWQSVLGLAALTVILVGIVVISSTGAQSRTLRADVLSTRRAEPGEPVAVTISTRDTLGSVSGLTVDFGDGHSVDRGSDEPPTCESAGARVGTFDFEHTYSSEGVFTVRARVRSEGCGAPPEERTAVRTIVVKPLRRP